MNQNPRSFMAIRLMCASLLLLILIPGTPAMAIGPLCFVDASATGTNNGTSWTDAYTDLQSALGESSCTEIWVAAGRYLPTTSSDQTVSFKPKQGVALYGGFSGKETERNQRDWQANITVLSGDIDRNDITDANGVVTDPGNIVGNNTYQVLIGCGMDEASILDGFTITGGSARGGIHDMPGGGMYTGYGCYDPTNPHTDDPSLINLIFSGNTGGAMYTFGKPFISNTTFIHNKGDGVISDHGNPVLDHVIFQGNGGGVYLYYGGPIMMTNVVFIDNGSAVYAGNSDFTLINGIFSGNTGDAIILGHSNAQLTNVSIWGNGSGLPGGAIDLDSSGVTVNNSIVWGNSGPDGTQIYQVSMLGTIRINYSLVQGGCPATGSDTICDHLLVNNPLFEDASNGNLHLQSGSPAIDAGDNNRVPPGTLNDVAGNPRFIDIPGIFDTGNGVPPIVDMGAYEHQVPIAVDNSYKTNEDIQLMVSTPGVLGNDIELNGNALTAVLDVGPAHGLLTLNSDGSFVYTPTLNYNGKDSFTYHAYDGELDSNIATVNLTITPVNDAPIANNQSVTTAEDTAKAITLTATDVENDPLTWTIVTPPAHGTITGTRPALTYTPNQNYNGPDSFTFKVNDGKVDSNIATVTITVTPVNDAPVAVNDSYLAGEGTVLIVNTPGVLGNDTDIENNPLTAILNIGPLHGDLTLNSNGSFVYTPDPGFLGTDSFTYHANDGGLNSNIAMVTITVGVQIEICYLPRINR